MTTLKDRLCRAGLHWSLRQDNLIQHQILIFKTDQITLIIISNHILSHLIMWKLSFKISSNNKLASVQPPFWFLGVVWWDGLSAADAGLLLDSDELLPLRRNLGARRRWSRKWGASKQILCWWKNPVMCLAWREGGNSGVNLLRSQLNSPPEGVFQCLLRASLSLA